MTQHENPSDVTASRPDTDSAVPQPSGMAPRSPRRFAKQLLLAGVIMVAVTALLTTGNALSLQTLAAQESALRSFQQQHAWLVLAGAFLLYVTVTGLSLPIASPLSLAYGWYFGFWRGLLLVSFASTAGATVAFLMSRYLLRSWVTATFRNRMQSLESRFQAEGPFFLFSLRLIPAVPFYVINLAMGLTPIRTRTFWWVSQLGMLPGTAVYLYAGSRVPNLQLLADEGARAALSGNQLLQFSLAFTLLGIFPWIVRSAFRKLSPKFSPSCAGPTAQQTPDT